MVILGGLGGDILPADYARLATLLTVQVGALRSAGSGLSAVACDWLSSRVPGWAEAPEGPLDCCAFCAAGYERRPGDADTIQKAVAAAVAKEFGDNPVKCSMQALVFTAVR